MTITLEEGMQAFVEKQLHAGLYATPDEAVNALLKERLAQDDAENEELKASLRVAMAQEPIRYRKGMIVELVEGAIKKARPA